MVFGVVAPRTSSASSTVYQVKDERCDKEDAGEAREIIRNPIIPTQDEIIEERLKDIFKKLILAHFLPSFSDISLKFRSYQFLSFFRVSIRRREDFTLGAQRRKVHPVAVTKIEFPRNQFQNKFDPKKYQFFNYVEKV